MILRDTTRLARFLAGWLVLTSALLTHTAEAGTGSAGTFFPKPGTYTLHKIQKAPTGWVLEESFWRPRRLSSYVGGGAVTLFSFFYTTCTDLQGCPVAWLAYQNVQEEIKKDPSLHGRVRLVFLTLNPKVDTPEQLAMFAQSFGDQPKIAPWHFLTTWSEAFLKPILAEAGQTASRELDAEGRPTEVINHMIKVYLIDENQWVREIYTTAFLDPDVILSDIRTLLMEQDRKQKRED
jgi:cytochrome oxidase Cu insertion factor (SCO1/SenC/PrrC family)